MENKSGGVVATGQLKSYLENLLKNIENSVEEYWFLIKAKLLWTPLCMEQKSSNEKS